MRLGSCYADGGHPRACGPGDDDALTDLNRADATFPADLQQIPGRLDDRTSQWTLGKTAVI
jgi:hypothetical protein